MQTQPVKPTVWFRNGTWGCPVYPIRTCHTWLTIDIFVILFLARIITNIAGWAGISPFSIGNTSSIRVHFPASYVSLPQGTSHFETPVEASPFINQ